MIRLSIALLFVLAQILYALDGQEAKSEGVIPTTENKTEIAEGSGEGSGEGVEGSGTGVEGSGIEAASPTTSEAKEELKPVIPEVVQPALPETKATIEAKIEETKPQA